MWPQIACALLVVFFLILAAGCQLAHVSHLSTLPVKQENDQRKLLKPLSPGMDAVQLDIVYVERDADDPLLSRLIWEDIDQVGTVDLETRSRLRGYGFRVGLVGMTPPRSLQRLLGLKNDLTDAAGTSRHTDLIGRQTFLQSGGTTEIQTGMPLPEMEVQLPDSDETAVLENAHGVFKAEVERMQDGWIKLHLTPEIHHGISRLRPVATNSRFEYEGGQSIEQFRDLTFTVTMNVGEMLIISADAEQDDSLAESFFVNRNGQRPRRYLVGIRLTDMKKIEPLYDE